VRYIPRATEIISSRKRLFKGSEKKKGGPQIYFGGNILGIHIERGFHTRRGLTIARGPRGGSHYFVRNLEAPLEN